MRFDERMNFRHPLRFIVLLAATLFTAPPARAGEVPMNQMWGESVARPDSSGTNRGRLFRDGNYAMFIHWGLYSHLAGKWKDQTYYGIGEWIMNRRMAGIPVEEYKPVAKEFNPAAFDGRAIAQVAKDAGMKYIVITAKHHEGFAMFDSEVDPFNIVDATPFKRDPMKELARACRELGLGFGFYYSHNQDWTAPGGSGGPKTNADGTPATFENYFRTKCVPQVKELCTGYGPLEIVWFDTPGSMEKSQVHELYNVVHQLQPGALMCSRIGHGLGDYASKGDMEVPLRNIEGLWETCDTINDSWAYAWYDQNWKEPKEILHRLIATVGRGGTYLFNVGLDGQGRVPGPAASFLRDAGEWLRRYPEVVYAAGPSPWGHALPWGDVTTQGDTLQLAVFDWPADGRLILPGLQTEIASATALRGGKEVPVEVERKGNWTTLKTPAAAPDPLVSVLKVRLKGPAKVDQTHGVPPNQSIELPVEFASVSGAEKKRLSWMEKFGEWKFATQAGNWTTNGAAAWTVDVLEPGFYKTSLTYKGEGRVVWSIETDEGVRLQNQQGSGPVYHTWPFGLLEFKTSGRHKVTVSLVDGNREKASLETLRLTALNQE